MRLVFMGTPTFAVPSLRAVAAVHDVVAVLTAPDRPRGRGRVLSSSPVRAAAVELGLVVSQPTTLRDAATVARLASLTPEVVCVAAYGLLLPPETLAVPSRGCLNVHASLLPRHRGAAPVHRAILQGDATTGVSIMRMEPTLDTGPVAAAVEVPVGDHDLASLTTLLAEEGARLLVEVLASVERGEDSWLPQDEGLATYASKVSRDDLALSPDQTAQTFLRRVRASTRSAPARAVICGVASAVSRAAGSDAHVSPGRVVSDGGSLFLGLADAAVEVLTMRPDSRSEMPGAAFACGLKDPVERAWVSEG